MKDRLLKFLTREKLSSARFAEIIGVQPSSISHIISGRNKPGFDFIQKILINYPSLSAEWLITGQGNMLKSDNIQGELFNSEYSGNTELSVEKQDENIHTSSERGNNKSDYDPGISDTNVTTEKYHEDYKSEYNKATEITNVNNERDIEKIIILYSDKSFGEYSPK